MMADDDPMRPAATRITKTQKSIPPDWLASINTAPCDASGMCWLAVPWQGESGDIGGFCSGMSSRLARARASLEEAVALVVGILTLPSLEFLGMAKLGA